MTDIIEATRPVVRFSLTEVARATVDDTEFVIYSDGAFQVSMEADIFDEETTETDYSRWCADTDAVASVSLARKILRAEAGQSFGRVDHICLSGSCKRVDLAIKISLVVTDYECDNEAGSFVEFCDSVNGELPGYVVLDAVKSDDANDSSASHSVIGEILWDAFCEERASYDTRGLVMAALGFPATA
jgi:hypothetical protein